MMILLRRPCKYNSAGIVAASIFRDTWVVDIPVIQGRDGHTSAVGLWGSKARVTKVRDACHDRRMGSRRQIVQLRFSHSRQLTKQVCETEEAVYLTQGRKQGQGGHEPCYRHAVLHCYWIVTVDDGCLSFDVSRALQCRSPQPSRVWSMHLSSP